MGTRIEPSSFCFLYIDSFFATGIYAHNMYLSSIENLEQKKEQKQYS